MSQFAPYDAPPVMNVPSGAPPASMSALAVVSLILGILGFCSAGLLGLVGVILGIIAIAKVNKSAGAIRGSGLAIAGICVGACSVLTCPLSVAVLLPAIGKAREGAQALKAQTQLSELGMAVRDYQNDHNGLFPDPGNWIVEANTLLSNQADRLMVWPGRPEGRAFAMNEHLKGIRINQIRHPAQVPVLFEVYPHAPSLGGAELLPDRPRGSRGYLMLFADRRVAFVPREHVESGTGTNQILWNPLEPQ